MGFPEVGNVYLPPPPGALELNLGDEWRARWVDEQVLPKGSPVVYGYALVFLGDRGYVTRKRDSEKWGTVEGELLPGEKPDAFVKRAARDQTGAVPGRIELVGYLECRATSHNKRYERDVRTVQPIHLVVARDVKDVPDGSGFERRRLPLNEYMATIRSRYPELEGYLAKAVERYVVSRARGGMENPSSR